MKTQDASVESDENPDMNNEDHKSDTDHVMNTHLRLDANIDKVTDRTQLIALQKDDPDHAYAR